jgi:hypothetical protein
MNFTISIFVVQKANVGNNILSPNALKTLQTAITMSKLDKQT